MSRQNVQIQQKHINEVFSIMELAMRSMKFAAINFSAVFPAFGNHPVITVLSFILIVGLYFFSRINTTLLSEKRNLNLLFALGISGSVFLSLLSIKAHNYTPFYNRYYSFCIPFCSLFTAYALYIIFKSKKLNSIIKGGSVILLSVPACGLFLLTLQRTAPQCKYNHVVVAQEIIKEKILKMEVPEWEDALLIQCFLPKGYQLDYVLNPNVPNFTLYKIDTTEKIPVVKDNT